MYYYNKPYYYYKATTLTDLTMMEKWDTLDAGNDHKPCFINNT